MTNIPIISLSDFKEKAFRKDGDFVNFNILLAGGIAISRKRVSYRPDEDKFLIIHEIDESYEEIASCELAEKSNFIEAIKYNALILTE